MKANNIFAAPYEHVETILLQRLMASGLSSASNTVATTTTSTPTTTSTTTTTFTSATTSHPKHSTHVPLHVELFKRIAPSSSSLSSLLRTYESVLRLLTEEEDEEVGDNEEGDEEDDKEDHMRNHRRKNNQQRHIDVSLLHGQVLYVLVLLAQLSFDPNNQGSREDVLGFQTSVYLLQYVAAVVYEWCVDATTDVAEGNRSGGGGGGGGGGGRISRSGSLDDVRLDLDDWREKVKVKLLQIFNVDDHTLVGRLTSTLRCHAEVYCAFPVCVQLQQCSLRASGTRVVWQKNVRQCWSLLCQLLTRPSAGIPSVLLFKGTGDASMLVERGGSNRVV